MSYGIYNINSSDNLLCLNNNFTHVNTDDFAVSLYGCLSVGNKFLLQCSHMWKKLLQHYRNGGMIVEADKVFPNV